MKVNMLLLVVLMDTMHRIMMVRLGMCVKMYGMLKRVVAMVSLPTHERHLLTPLPWAHLKGTRLNVCTHTLTSPCPLISTKRCFCARGPMCASSTLLTLLLYSCLLYAYQMQTLPWSRTRHPPPTNTRPWIQHPPPPPHGHGSPSSFYINCRVNLNLTFAILLSALHFNSKPAANGNMSSHDGAT